MKSNAKADNKIEQEKVCDLCKALRTNTALSELLFSEANRTKSKIKAVSGRTLFYHLENSSFIWQLSKPVTKKRQALKLWLGSFRSTFSSKYDFAVLNIFGKHFLATVSLPFPPNQLMLQNAWVEKLTFFTSTNRVESAKTCREHSSCSAQCLWKGLAWT